MSAEDSFDSPIIISTVMLNHRTWIEELGLQDGRSFHKLSLY